MVKQVQVPPKELFRPHVLFGFKPRYEDDAIEDLGGPVSHSLELLCALLLEIPATDLFRAMVINSVTILRFTT